MNPEQEAAQASAITAVSNLLRCILCLLQHGIHVTGFRGWRCNGADRVVVTVEAGPQLFALFGEQCYWSQRRTEGQKTIYTRFTDCFGIRVEWEEMTCAD